MGGGSWNDNGLTPSHLCVWSKVKLGWIKPKAVTGKKALTLSSIETDGKAANRLWTKGKSGTEYFLIENRQLVGFDRKLPGSGLLIWHIDDAEHNNNHAANYMVGLRQADGRKDLETGSNGGDAGDPFPGTSRNKKFDAKSNPAATDRLGRPTAISLTGIAVKQQKVTCTASV